MDPILVVVVLASLVLGSTILGVVYRSTRGRVTRSASAEETMAIDGVVLGDRATLLQFSTEVCAPCVATARVLSDVARQTDAVTHVDLDISDRPELLSKYNVLQTPTTFILDRHGVVRARIGGVVRRDSVTAELERVLANS